MKGRLSHVVFCAFAAASALCVSAALSGCDEVASLFQSGKNPQNVAELCDGKHTGRHAAYQSVIDEACRKLKDAESSNSRLREQSESLGNTGEILTAEVQSVRGRAEKRIAEKDAKIRELSVQNRSLSVKLADAEKRLNTETARSACAYRKGVSAEQFIKKCKKNRDCAFVSEVYEKLAGKSAVWAKMLGREYDPKYSQNICFKADKKKAESWYGRAK